MTMIIDGTNGVTFPNTSVQTVAGAPLATPSFTTTIGVGAATASASGAGVTFPATQSDSSNVNTLDDYEEGTWSPSVGGTATYSLQSGKYTKIGNMVTVYYDMVVTTIGTGQTYGITNLPFVVSNSGTGAVGYSGNTSATKTASFNIWSYCDPNTTSLFYGGWTSSGVNSVPLQTVQNGTYLRGTCTYFTS